MNEYESFAIKGRMVYQTTREEDGYKRRAVHQPDGTWWMYSFYPAHRSGIGVPLRGKSRQAQILAFVEEVKAALAAAE